MRKWNYKAVPEEVDVSEQPKSETEKGSLANIVLTLLRLGRALGL